MSILQALKLMRKASHELDCERAYLAELAPLARVATAQPPPLPADVTEDLIEAIAARSHRARLLRGRAG